MLNTMNTFAGDSRCGFLRAAAITLATALPSTSTPRVALTDESSMSDLGGAIGWLNSAPLNAMSLRGKVVLVDFWTYTCINSLRPLRYVKSWAAKYKGLVGGISG